MDQLKKPSDTQMTAVEKPPYTTFTGHRRMAIVVIVCAAGFLGPVAGNIYLPLLKEFAGLFSTSVAAINGTVSAFMGVFAIAPLFWGFLADWRGRKPGYVLLLGIYVAASIVLAACPPKLAILYVFRVLQAVGAAGVMLIGTATIADISEPKVRGRYISYFMIGPQLGPVLGPILSLAALNGNWRWVFGILAILGGVVYLVILWVLPETSRTMVGNGEGILITPLMVPKVWYDKRLAPRMPPPVTIRLIFQILSFPPVVICAVTSGLLFSTFYGVVVMFGQVLADVYHINRVGVSLLYLVPGACLIIGSLTSGRVSDWHQNKHNHENRPEQRFSLMLVGLAVLMISVMVWGWVVYKRAHVAALYVVTAFAALGMTWVFTITSTYLTQCPGKLPATKVALANMFRNGGAAITLAIIEPLVKRMGIQWCFLGLGLIDTISIVLVLMLIKYGEQWRLAYQKKLLPPPKLV